MAEDQQTGPYPRRRNQGGDIRMIQIPDAPWIQETESRGADYVEEFLFGEDEEEEDE